MLDRLAGLHPVLQALLAGLFTWALTALGAALVLFTTRISRRLFDGSALSFAAGAMIYVVVEEIIPEAARQGNIDLATLCLVGGFTVMMILDVALG